MKLFGKNKRGIELAINFLVTFILAVVIFGAGLVLIRGMVSNSGDDLTRIQDDLDKRIQSLSCSAKDKLCLSNNEATVSRGDILYFGVHVNNYLSQEVGFTITINTTSMRGYSGETEINRNNIAIKPLPVTQSLSVKPKQQGEKGFAMVIPKNVKAGQYFYTIHVVTDNAAYKKVSETLIFTVK